MSENKPRTYCNPISLPDIPLGSDGWGVMRFTNEKQRDYRSVSDPSVLYLDGKWYLYPSYGMAFVSEDFVTWKHVRTKPYDMKYSPTVVPFRGKYLMTSHSHGLYISDSPLGDFEYLGDFVKPDGTEFRPVDPALFVDDDGRLYLYCFMMRGGEHKRTFVSGSFGAELDGDDPRRLVTDPVMLNTFDRNNVWERFGEYNQDTLCGWIEGQWMLKKNGRYYLVYASSGTEFSNYCMAAYYSDKGPLEGFVLQKNNPVTISRSRLMTGAGHGCITEGPGGTLWAFYTTAVACVHLYERVIGMDLVAINSDGELYAPHGVTEIPQLAPGVAEDPVKDNSSGMLPLTVRQRAGVIASSATEGRDAFYALDGTLLTYWRPREDDPRPTLTVDMMAPYIVGGVRIIWRDIGLDEKNGALRGPYRWILEGRPDNDRDEWVMLLDAGGNDTDLLVDYRELPPVSCESVRLTVCGHPDRVFPAVIDFTVFGKRDESI